MKTTEKYSLLFIVLGTILITIGITMNQIQLEEKLNKSQKEIKEYKEQVKKLDNRVDKALTEISKTNAENQYLWDIYYKSGIADQVRDWE